MKWSSQVVFETDLPPEAANAFSVYVSAHAMLSDCVSVPFLLVCFSHKSPVLNIMTLLSMYLYLNIPCRSQILSLRSNSVHFGARSLFDSCYVTDSGAASTLMRSHRM